MSKKISRIILILFICIFAIGVSIIWWVANSTDKNMRAELLLQARIAAQAINTQYVISLSGSEKDLKNPAYQRIKSQLASMRNAIDNCRFLYLMGRRSDGQVFFFMDSLPPDSKDYAPPGLVYDEVSDGYIRTFETNAEAVVGPVTDRWGTLITALVPLRDPHKRNMIAVLGMDVDADYWNKEILSRCLLPFTITLLFLVLILLLFSREKVAKSLRQSENKLRATLDATPFPVAVVDLNDDKIFYWSHSALTLFGHTASTTFEWYQIAYPDPDYRKEVLEKWKSFLDKAKKTGQPINTGEYRVTCKDGSERSCELYATFLPDNLIVTFNDITERKRAEEDLFKIFSMSLDMICIADIKTATLTKVNAAFTQILGYSEEELLEKPFLDFVHPDDIDATLAVIDKKLKVGAKVINFENRYRCKDGTYRWLSWVSHPDTEKGVTYAIARDITEWKQNEEELRTSKDLLDATGLMAKVGGWDLDANTLEVTWTEETYRIHEMARDYKPTVKEAINFFHPQDKPKLEQAIQLALNRGEPYDLEIRFINAKGEHLWTRTKCEPEVMDGKVVKLKGTFQDITDLKTAEKAIIESEKRYKYLYENAQVGLGRTRIADGKILDCNNKMAEIFGYSDKKEFIKEYILSENYVDKSLREHFLSEISLSGFIRNREAEFFRKDGKTVWVRFDTRILPDHDFMEDVIIDITEQKIAEKERAKLKDQLQQAQKMESIGNLAGGIAHDFNNILSSIIGFTELALDDVDKDSAVKDSLQEVYKAGKRAKDLVWQILTFARQTDDPIKPIQVDSIAKEVLKFIRSSIPTTIGIQQNIDSDSLIMGNPTQVHQIIMNLCTNAAQAMEESGGTLEFSLMDVKIDHASPLINAGLRSGDYIEITVSDTGPGIPPDVIHHVFEPYFTTKAPGEGTGMGLALVQGIVAQSGGKVSVDSQMGKGTVFKVYLPITKKRRVSESFTTGTLPKGTERILFVDDEAPIAKMGSQELERLGYSVTTRTSSIEALELFQAKPNDFDLVVTDMTMPNLTGDKFAIELMKIRPDIPVILCTGYSKNISNEIASEIGIKAFAYKPVVRADLAKTVRKVLDEEKRKICT